MGFHAQGAQQRTRQWRVNALLRPRREFIEDNALKVANLDV